VYRGADGAPGLLFRADAEYLRALPLLDVSIALTPYDPSDRPRAAIWSPSTGPMRFEGEIRSGWICRELENPLALAELVNPVTRSAGLYQVRPADIRAFALYAPETWDALRGQAILVRRDGNRRAAATEAILRYRVSGGRVKVEVEP
jgi:hypothetical protein